MKVLIIKQRDNIRYGSIKKVAQCIGVHKNTVSRWLNSGDRKVVKKKINKTDEFEIYLNAEKL